jgi:hypothetical protein
MFNHWINFTATAQLGFESQQVIALRCMAMAQGGAGALREAERMVNEKTQAAMAAFGTLAAGGSIETVIGNYRDVVQANNLRLTAGN